MSRQRVLEQLMVEASDNDQRKVHAGSVRLTGDRHLDWTEKTNRGLVARSGLVDWPTFWRLVDEALSA